MGWFMLKKVIVRLLILSCCSMPVQAESPTESGVLDLSEYKGELVYLDFWASWCGPCRASFPWMNALQADLEAKGLQVIAVNVDAHKQAADQFLLEYPADFKVIFDPEGKLAEAHNVTGMPSSFLYGREGQLISSHIGFNNEISVVLRGAIEEALKQ